MEQKASLPDQIAEMYQRGEPVEGIRRALHVSVHRVYHTLKERGIPLRRKCFRQGVYAEGYDKLNCEGSRMNPVNGCKELAVDVIKGAFDDLKSPNIQDELAAKRFLDNNMFPWIDILDLNPDVIKQAVRNEATENK